MPEKKKPSVVAIIFSILAIMAGACAFVVAGLRGHSAGWEMMAIYTLPALISGAIAIAVRRNALSYVALGFVGLSVLGFFMGA